MALTTGRGSSDPEVTSSDAILERARVGTRLMTIRGAVMRSISVGSNLLLLVLVSPTELGLLAVARGTFSLLQYLAELGIAKALLRRPAAPTNREYAALAGLQLMVSVLVVSIGAVWSAPILGFGAIDKQWHYAMLGTVATMSSLAFGAGARIRLERALAYERLARVDVFNVLALNTGLVVVALLDQFSAGVFIVLGVATVTANGLLYKWAPGPRPSLDLRPLGGIARQSSGFLVASTSAVLREQGTAVLIGGLFGLPVAGMYSFAERVAQVLNVTFDGFRNASIPAASRLAGDVRALRALASRTLAGSASLSAPMAILAICALPVLAHFVPRWSSAVLLAQWYVSVYAIWGVISASVEPAAVAMHGSRIAITEQVAALTAGWLGFAAMQFLGPNWIAVGVVMMYIAPLLALLAVSHREIRPEATPEVRQIGIGFLLALSTYATLRSLGVPIWFTTTLPVLLIFAMVPRMRSMPAMLRARWLNRSALA